MSKDPSEPRIQTADRHQFRLLPTTIDELIDEKHRVREIWSWLDSFALAPFYARIKARGSAPGRPAIDPKILLCLWVFATSEGIGSARRLERLCERDLAYRWILGGVSVNYHTLADFRSTYERELDELMTDILAVLLKAEVLSLDRVSHDGVRVRASAGAASFRREKTLEQCLEEAEKQVEEVKRQEQESEETLTAREKKARERGAREKKERIQKALVELPKVRAAKTKEEYRKNTRMSTTDPDAQIMKMANGGFCPAYNVQLAMDTKSRILLGVEVTNRGNDFGEISPMQSQVKQRTGVLPREYLVDGGYVEYADLEAASKAGSTIYAPVRKPNKKKGETPEERETRLADRFKPKEKDTPEVRKWRERMGTEEAKKIYKDRASTIELANADLRAHRGLQQFRVRGKTRVRAVALLKVITYNILRAMSLLKGGPP